MDVAFSGMPLSLGTTHPHADNSIPADERRRIDNYCERQIQHEWCMHRQGRHWELR